jgi:hypothetical protein
VIARDSFQQLLPLFGADAVRLLFCKCGERTEIRGSLAGIVCQCFNLQLRPSSVPASLRWRWLCGAGDRCRFVTAASGCAGELPAGGPGARQTPNLKSPIMMPGPRRASGWMNSPDPGAHTCGQIGISTKLGNLNAGPLIRPNREFRAIPGGHADPAGPAKSPGPGIPESRAGGYFPAGQLEAGTGQGRARFGDFATARDAAGSGGPSGTGSGSGSGSGNFELH